MNYTYEYPRPSVTLDAAVLRTPKLKYPEVLLIRRGHDPFSGLWALPGGFMEMNENPLVGAARELAEETSLLELPLKPLFSCGETGRDPRGRTVTIVFGCLIRDAETSPKAADDAAEAKWFALNDLPALAFDHKRVIAQIEQNLLWQARTAIVGQDVFHGVASAKDIIRLHQNLIPDTSEELIQRSEKLGLLECTDGICTFKTVVPHGPDWHPMVW